MKLLKEKMMNKIILVVRIFTASIVDQVVYLGGEEKDFLKVQGADGEGWVYKKLMKK